MWVMMSERMRWWPLDGVTGMGMAPERLAMPPASLHAHKTSASRPCKSKGQSREIYQPIT